MRKSVKSIIAVTLSVLAVIGCAKQSDLNEVNSRLDGIENRVSNLEDALKQLNEKDIPSLRELVRAIQNNITVTAVVETESGYVISFSDGTTATLRNGKDGKAGRDGVDGIDGVDGVDGVDGNTPVIGITLVDGVYVWTVNGNILKDDAGNPIPVTGNDGKDGTDGVDGVDGVDGITPLFGILDGHWVVSYDNGETWKTLGLTSDTDYSAYLDPDKETDDYIVLVVGATEVQIPKEKAFTLTFTIAENNGVKAGSTASFPYTISGVNATDQTDVDVIGIVGDWTAEVVPTDNASGVLKVTATESESAKVTVYAANHKGKTDIRTLKFEGGVLEAIIETHDIEWEGGELPLTVRTNMAYEVYIPTAAQEWITVAPATRVHVDSLAVTVAKNETGAYRTATLEVLDEGGNTAKEIEILQYANPEVATDLASVVALPDDKAVLVNAVTVVAASKASTIVTDGEAFSYVTNYIGTPGTVIDITGTKKSDGLGLGYVEASEVKENTEAEPAEVVNTEHYMYYGYGYNQTYFYTANNGYISEKDGVYYATAWDEPQQFVIEDPAQDLSALVGKFVAMSGWVKACKYEYNVVEDYHIVLTDIHEIVFAEEAGWKPYYAGMTSGESGYPELVGNEVSNPTEDSFYTLGVYTEEEVSKYASMEEFIASAAFVASDDFLFNLTYYGSYGYDFVFSVFAHNESAEDSFKEFGFGKHYVVALGLDAEGRISGKYAVTAFEKEDPRQAWQYEDFIGTWSVGGTEWTISEKENGVSYNIDGIQGSSSLASRGGNMTVVANYDAENGMLTVDEQELAFYDDPSGNGYGLLCDYFSGVFAYGSSTYRNFPVNGDATTVFTMAGLKDGTAMITPGECEYGTFAGFVFQWIIQEGEYAMMGNTYGSPVSMPIDNIKRVQKVKAAYEDFLGSWNVGGMDTWTITQKEAGKTYTVTGIYGLGDIYSGANSVEAAYDAENGEFYVTEQYLGEFNSDEISAFSQNPYGMCSDYLSGIFSYGGSTYPAYPVNVENPSTIFVGAMDPSGNVQLAPGSCDWGSFISLGFSWAIQTGENAGKGNKYNYLTDLPNEMVKQSAGSSSVRKANTQKKVAADRKLSAPAVKAVATPKVEKKDAGKNARISTNRLVKF